MSEEIASADALLRENAELRAQLADLSRQIGEQSTTIGYQDAKLRQAAADAGWLRGLVMRAIAHLDTSGGRGKESASLAEDLEVMLARTGDAGAALLSELEAARAVVAATRSFPNKLMSEALFAYDQATKARG